MWTTYVENGDIISIGLIAIMFLLASTGNPNPPNPLGMEASFDNGLIVDFSKCRIPHTFTISVIKPQCFKLPSKKLDSGPKCTPNPEEPQVTPRYPTHPCMDIRGQQIVKSSPTPQLSGLYQYISRFYNVKNFNFHFSGIKKQNCTACGLQGCIAPRMRRSGQQKTFICLARNYTSFQDDSVTSSCGEDMSTQVIICVSLDTIRGCSLKRGVH